MKIKLHRLLVDIQSAVDMHDHGSKQDAAETVANVADAAKQVRSDPAAGGAFVRYFNDLESQLQTAKDAYDRGDYTEAYRVVTGLRPLLSGMTNNAPEPTQDEIDAANAEADAATNPAPDETTQDTPQEAPTTTETASVGAGEGTASTDDTTATGQA